MYLRIVELGEGRFGDHGTTPTCRAATSGCAFVIVVEFPWYILEARPQGRQQQIVLVCSRVDLQSDAVIDFSGCWDSVGNLKSMESLLDQRKCVLQRPIPNGLCPDQKFVEMLVLAEIKLTHGRHAIRLALIDPVEVEDSKTVVDCAGEGNREFGHHVTFPGFDVQHL
jgi:hypothetical protein